MSQSLSQVVNWSHRLLGEVLGAGDFAIDLTAGNGYDTLMLAQAVGPTGRVLALDLQNQALEKSAECLRQQGFFASRPDVPVIPLPLGVSLAQASHADLSVWCDRPPQAIIANLGYLPGGDKNLVTKPDSTLMALHAGCDLLAPGGRIAVVVYTGHPGGRSEAGAVEGFFAKLDERKFEVLRLEVVNRPQAPFLLTAGKLN